VVRTKIRKKGRRWYVAVVDDAGRESSPGLKGFDRERDAKAAAKELEVDSSRGRYVSPSKITVAEYLAEWLEARQNADLSPNSRAVEAIMVRAWIVPYIGGIGLQQLSARDLDKLYRRLRERPLKGKSIRNAHVLLHKALSDALRRGYVLSNVVGAVDPPNKDDSQQRRAWNGSEVRRFLAVAAEDRLHAVWRLFLASGARRGEICGLRWEDVQGARLQISRQVLVRPTRGWDEDRVYVRETTKSGRVRTVTVDQRTESELRRWKAEQGRERLAFGAAYKDGRWIVSEADGATVHPDTLSARWRRLEKRAGVPPIGLHGARHTHATLALAAGARLDVVSRGLGHASVAITADVYGHPDEEAAAKAAELVARAFEGR
jgi:integrase